MGWGTDSFCGECKVIHNEKDTLSVVNRDLRLNEQSKVVTRLPRPEDQSKTFRYSYAFTHRVESESRIDGAMPVYFRSERVRYLKSNTHKSVCQC